MSVSIPPLGPVSRVEPWMASRALEELETFRTTIAGARPLEGPDGAPKTGTILVHPATAGRSIVTVSLKTDEDDAMLDMRTAFASSSLHVDTRLLAAIVEDDATDVRRIETMLALARRAFNDASVSWLQHPVDVDPLRRIVTATQARHGSDDDIRVLDASHPVGEHPSSFLVPARVVGDDPDGIALATVCEPFLDVAVSETAGLAMRIRPHRYVVYGRRMDAVERLRIIAEDDAARTARRSGSW